MQPKASSNNGAGPAGDASRTIGGYVIHPEFASGGMATVHFGHRVGAVGFSRLVAIKRMRPELSKDRQFLTMFLDEAWLVARIQHPHVVPTLDVVSEQGELFIVMEYVRGLAFSTLRKLAGQRREPVSPDIAAAVVGGALEGLHAAHEARGEQGRPLEIVHRDTSPHNILVGIDGVARIMDFGVAKATSRLHVTGARQIKGKVNYMAPEQLTGKSIDRRVDVFAAGVVLWEALAGRRRFVGETFEEVLGSVLSTETEPLAGSNGVTPELDEVIARATARDRDQRYASADEFLQALERAQPLASRRALGAWVQRLGMSELVHREESIREVEPRERADIDRAFAELDSSDASFRRSRLHEVDRADAGSGGAFDTPTAGAEAEANVASGFEPAPTMSSIPDSRSRVVDEPSAAGLASSGSFVGGASYVTRSRSLGRRRLFTATVGLIAVAVLAFAAIMLVRREQGAHDVSEPARKSNVSRPREDAGKDGAGEKVPQTASSPVASILPGPSIAPSRAPAEMHPGPRAPASALRQPTASPTALLPKGL